MIFEKNPFTTAVSIPKSFHLTPEAPTLKNIDQPYSYIVQSFNLQLKKKQNLNICNNYRTFDDKSTIVPQASRVQ